MVFILRVDGTPQNAAYSYTMYIVSSKDEQPEGFDEPENSIARVDPDQFHQLFFNIFVKGQKSLAGYGNCLVAALLTVYSSTLQNDELSHWLLERRANPNATRRER
jgi:hypothetical protein